jgi:hypothetical protein
MKSKLHLPIFDINDLIIFNKFIVYSENRNLKSLVCNPLIRKLDSKIKNRVIHSMLEPNKESLKIYNEVINGSVSNEIIDYLILLYKKIIKIHNPEKINIIAIMRSGLPLAQLLRYLIYKIHGVKIKISAISPNYIDKIDINKFENYIKNLDKNTNSVFIDSWCSEGVTYNIIKKFWSNLFPEKIFWYAVLSNLSPIKEKSLIYATREDILIPWSICQTDNVGFSNYFPHHINEVSCAFVIPKEKIKIKDNDFVYRKLIDYKIKHKISLNESSQKYIKPKNIKYYNTGIIKLGINECIKSIDKKDDIKLYISNSKNPYNIILKKYAKVNSIEYQNTPNKQSFVIRKFS